ncbi:MAG: GAF domain-containing protein [Gammaproteobacteria bacterium]
MEALNPLQLIERIERLSHAQASILSPMERESLLIRILVGAKKVAHADGGTLYLLEKDVLSFQMLLNDSLNITEPKNNFLKEKLKSIPLKDASGLQNLKNVSTAAAITGKSINISDAYHSDNYDFTGTKRIDGETGYHSQSVLAIPIKSISGTVVGVLQLINRIDDLTKKVKSFSAFDQKMAESFALQAADALTNQSTLTNQKALLADLEKMIDAAKQKASLNALPILVEELLQALQKDRSAPLRALMLADDEIFDLHVAACLLDNFTENFNDRIDVNQLNGIIQFISKFKVHSEHVLKLLTELHYNHTSQKQQQAFIEMVTILASLKAMMLAKVSPLPRLPQVIEVLQALSEQNKINSMMLNHLINQKLYRKFADKFLKSEQLH